MGTNAVRKAGTGRSSNVAYAFYQERTAAPISTFLPELDRSRDTYKIPEKQNIVPSPNPALKMIGTGRRSSARHAFISAGA